MFKRFSFWIVALLILFLGSITWIHWKGLVDLRHKTMVIQTLYQREKVIDSLSLNLERYRRLSTGFRKLTPGEVAEIKARLKKAYSDGSTQLDRLDLTSEERYQNRKLLERIEELLEVSAKIEPTLFTQDAYVKPDVQDIHDKILSTLANLERSTEGKISSLQITSTQPDFRSVVLILAVSGGAVLLLLSLFLRNYFTYGRPLKRLYLYARELKPCTSTTETLPNLTGPYLEIQRILRQLALEVETYIKSRHKFILDIVADLKTPLSLLQEGKNLLGAPDESMNEKRKLQAEDSVRRGLIIFSGSLEDLNDLADFGRLEARLDETTVDLADLISNVAHTMMGFDTGKRITVSFPPMPVWARVDSRRLQRVLIQVVSKVISTLPEEGNLSISLGVPSQQMGSTGVGVEIVVQDAERMKGGRVATSGPEQDILKHWVSEAGLSMTLVQRIIKAHGGSIMAAGVAGTSVTMVIRFPQDRVVSQALISAPLDSVSPGLRGSVVQNGHAPAEGQTYRDHSHQ